MLPNFSELEKIFPIETPSTSRNELGEFTWTTSTKRQVKGIFIIRKIFASLAENLPKEDADAVFRTTDKHIKKGDILSIDTKKYRVIHTPEKHGGVYGEVDYYKVFLKHHE